MKKDEPKRGVRFIIHTLRVISRSVGIHMEIVGMSGSRQTDYAMYMFELSLDSMIMQTCLRTIRRLLAKGQIEHV